MNEKWREKIRTSMLINRLQEHALSPDEFITDKKTGKRTSVGPKVRMADSQIRAAELLLRKVAPDLVRTTIEGGDEDKPVRFAKEMTDEELIALASKEMPKSSRSRK